MAPDGTPCRVPRVFFQPVLAVIRPTGNDDVQNIKPALLEVAAGSLWLVTLVTVADTWRAFV
jgi:hypothetical protein